jgi:hypothetical protein
MGEEHAPAVCNRIATHANFLGSRRYSYAAWLTILDGTM